jgi:hypothetical protein
MSTKITTARVSAPTEKGAREPICCPIVPDKLLARIDWERRLLYLWCKGCHGYHEFDLDALEEQHTSAVTQSA